MDNIQNKIPLMGPNGLYYATPNEAPGLAGVGFKPATQEDIEFSSAPQKIIGGLEVVGRGTIPFFTAAELLAGAEPERIRKRKEISIGEDLADAGEFASMLVGPAVVSKGLGMIGKLSGVSKVAEMAATASKFGTKAGIAETLGNAVADGIEGRVGRLATKYGIEGAAFGVMDQLDKSLISPEPKDALSVAADAVTGGAIGFVLGAAGGATVGVGKNLWEAKFGKKATRVLEQIQADTKTPDLPQNQSSIPTPPSGPGSQTLSQPTSISDIRKITEKLPAITEEALPEKQPLLDAISRVKDEPGIILPHEAEIQALDNQIVKDKYRAALEFGDKDSAALLNYRQAVKKSMVENIEKTISTINPNPIYDSYKGGLRTIGLYEKRYTAIKNSTKEFFKLFDKTATNPVSYLGEISGALENNIPGISKYIEYDGIDGALKLKPWDSTASFTDKTWDAVKMVVDGINKNDLTIGDLRNIRRNIKTKINYITGDKQTNYELTKLRKSLMDIVKSEIKKRNSTLPVEQMFETYAINENNLDEFESIVGGKLFGEGKLERQINPEDILKKIFANSTTVNSAKKILGEDLFNIVLGDYLAQAVEAAKDPAKKTFSSAQFMRLLGPKGKAVELEQAFANNLGPLQKIKDFTTIARIIPDQEPINPSGTAKTLMGMARQVLQAKNINPFELVGSISEMAANRVEKEEVKAFLNTILKGEGKNAKAFYKFLDTPAKVSASAFNTMTEYIKYASRGQYLMIRAAKSALDEQTKMPVIEKSPEELSKLDKHVQQLQENPEKLQNIAGEIPYYMPEQAGILGMKSARVINYLNSQRPGLIQNSPLDRPKPPSSSELMNYRRTLQIAANPAYVFKLIKEGRLLSKDVADLKFMYPDVYDKYLFQLVDSLADTLNEKKQIPLKVQKSLSLFGAMPLNSSLKPSSIQAAQATYQPQQMPQAQLPQMAKKSSRVSKLPSLTETDQQRRMLKQ